MQNVAVAVTVGWRRDGVPRATVPFCLVHVTKALKCYLQVLVHVGDPIKMSWQQDYHCLVRSAFFLEAVVSAWSQEATILGKLQFLLPYDIGFVV